MVSTPRRSVTEFARRLHIPQPIIEKARRAKTRLTRRRARVTEAAPEINYDRFFSRNSRSLTRWRNAVSRLQPRKRHPVFAAGGFRRSFLDLAREIERASHKKTSDHAYNLVF